MSCLMFIRRLFLLCWAGSLAAFVQGAAAAPVTVTLTEQDATSVRAVVQAQIDAFANGDAAKAFSLAAPGIQQMFGNAERFMSMVRAQYPMVHRAASVSFLRPEAQGEMVVQRVQMRDAAGTPWLVTYLVQRQSDKRWRIGACMVVHGTNRLMT